MKLNRCATICVRWSADAIAALQTAAEDYTANVLEDANFAALHAKRVTLQAKDIKLARRIRGDLPGDKLTVLQEEVTYWPAGEETAGRGEYDEHRRRIPNTGWIPPKARLGAETARRAEYDRRRRGESTPEEVGQAEVDAQAEKVRELQERVARRRAEREALRQEQVLAEERAREQGGEVEVPEQGQVEEEEDLDVGGGPGEKEQAQQAGQ